MLDVLADIGLGPNLVDDLVVHLASSQYLVVLVLGLLEELEDVQRLGDLGQLGLHAVPLLADLHLHHLVLA